MRIFLYNDRIMGLTRGLTDIVSNSKTYTSQKSVNASFRMHLV